MLAALPIEPGFDGVVAAQRDKTCEAAGGSCTGFLIVVTASGRTTKQSSTVRSAVGERGRFPGCSHATSFDPSPQPQCGVPRPLAGFYFGWPPPDTRQVCMYVCMYIHTYIHTSRANHSLFHAS